MSEASGGALQHSFEDVEALINNLLLCSTLTLAFTIAHLFGTFSVDDLETRLNAQDCHEDYSAHDDDQVCSDRWFTEFKWLLFTGYMFFRFGF